MSNHMTILALLNAMIGGTILILPLLFQKAGLLSSLIIIAVIAYVNYFSCALCLDHLGNQPDVPDSIQKQTQTSTYRLIYDLFCFLSILCILLLYFNLIVKQWNGLLGISSLFIPLTNTILLYALVFIMKKLELGASLLGYGIISIIGYVLFIQWVFSTRPIGDKQAKWLSWDVSQLSNVLGTALSLQGVFVPILRKNNNQASYHTLMKTVFVVGGVIYAYIGFAGSEGILNRKQLVIPAETVEDYFRGRDWEMGVIEVVYLVHLYSVFPEYLLIAKTRFYGLVNITEQLQIRKKDQFFIISVVAACLLVNLCSISLQSILTVNGTVLGYFFTYLMPISFHVYCTNKMSPKVQKELKELNQEKQIQKKEPIQKQTPRSLISTEAITFREEAQMNLTKSCNADYPLWKKILLVSIGLYGTASFLVSVSIVIYSAFK